MLVGVVACAAFAGHAVVQGEAVHGEVICVAGLVLEDDSALDEFVDAAAYGALVHLKHFAGCLAIRQEVVVFAVYIVFQNKDSIFVVFRPVAVGTGNRAKSPMVTKAWHETILPVRWFYLSCRCS